MEADEHQEKWPVVGQSDVADLCRVICDAIVGLERAFEAGELSKQLTSGSLEQTLGPMLYETYENLTKSAPGPLHDLRVEAVRALLAQLQNDLLPIQVARVRAHLAGCDSGESEAGTDPRPKLPTKFFDASFDGASSTTLRFDQMIDARFWRIGFTFETVELCNAFAREIVRTATTRLSSELRGLQRILKRLSRKTLDQKLTVIPYPSERRFEHLILDILNEEDRHARVAVRVEDFLEKTDLRVTYPGLNRRRGARVQVTSIIAPELHESKIQRIRLADEFVFLSPLSLAEFVGSLRSHAPVSSNPVTKPFALTSLWECLEVKPADVSQLASELKRVMLRALKGAPESPLGPMARVPLPIRQLIRLFVESEAIASTNRLREREKLSPRNSALRRNNLDDTPDRRQERAEFLGTLSVGDRIWGRVRAIAYYGAFIDLGCVDGLLHVSGIPGAANGTIGEKLTEGNEIEVEVLNIDIEQQRVSLGIPMDVTDQE